MTDNTAKIKKYINKINKLDCSKAKHEHQSKKNKYLKKVKYYTRNNKNYRGVFRGIKKYLNKLNDIQCGDQYYSSQINKYMTKLKYYTNPSKTKPRSQLKPQAAAAATTAHKVPDISEYGTPVPKISQKNKYEGNIYFEHQNAPLSCGRHALNNALGKEVFYKTGTRKMSMEEIVKSIPVIDGASIADMTDENYTYELLEVALLRAGYINIPVNGKNTFRHNINANLANKPIIIINLGNDSEHGDQYGKDHGNHWVSARIDPIRDVYYFDSLLDTPMKYDSIEDFDEHFIQKRTDITFMCLFILNKPEAIKHLQALLTTHFPEITSARRTSTRIRKQTSSNSPLPSVKTQKKRVRFSSAASH